MSYDKSYGKKSSDSYQKVPMNFEKILEQRQYYTVRLGRELTPKSMALKTDYAIL